MSDEPKGEQELAEAPANSDPTEESQETNPGQEEAQQQESPESETGNNEVESDAPKDNKAWAAKRVENKQLKEENERLKQTLETVDPQYLEMLRGATAPQAPQSPQYQPINDDVDYSEVTSRVNWTAEQATRANQQIAKLQQQLELQQDRQAEEAFPELKTDKVFQQIVAEKKLAARVLGRETTTYDIAKEVKSLLGKREEQVAVQSAEQTKEQMAQVRTATAEPRGTTSGGRSSQTEEELRMRVRKGDSDATDEVAKRIMGDLLS